MAKPYIPIKLSPRIKRMAFLVGTLTNPHGTKTPIYSTRKEKTLWGTDKADDILQDSLNRLGKPSQSWHARKFKSPEPDPDTR